MTPVTNHFVHFHSFGAGHCNFGPRAEPGSQLLDSSACSAPIFFPCHLPGRHDKRTLRPTTASKRKVSTQNILVSTSFICCIDCTTSNPVTFLARSPVLPHGLPGSPVEAVGRVAASASLTHSPELTRDLRRAGRCRWVSTAAAAAEVGFQEAGGLHTEQQGTESTEPGHQDVRRPAMHPREHNRAAAGHRVSSRSKCRHGQGPHPFCFDPRQHQVQLRQATKTENGGHPASRDGECQRLSNRLTHVVGMHRCADVCSSVQCSGSDSTKCSTTKI